MNALSGRAHSWPRLGTHHMSGQIRFSARVLGPSWSWGSHSGFRAQSAFGESAPLLRASARVPSLSTVHPCPGLRGSHTLHTGCGILLGGHDPNPTLQPSSSSPSCQAGRRTQQAFWSLGTVATDINANRTVFSHGVFHPRLADFYKILHEIWSSKICTK